MWYGGHQLRTRKLWDVTLDAQVTNDRGTGLTGANPYQINDGFAVSYFSIRVGTHAMLAITAIRIYGSDDPAAFPAPGTAAEALCQTTTNIVANRGIVRTPGMQPTNAGARRPFIVTPRFLMLEYSTGVPGTGAILFFRVFATMIGPHLSSTEG